MSYEWFCKAEFVGFQSYSDSHAKPNNHRTTHIHLTTQTISLFPNLLLSFHRQHQRSQRLKDQSPLRLCSNSQLLSALIQMCARQSGRQGRSAGMRGVSSCYRPSSRPHPWKAVVPLCLNIDSFPPFLSQCSSSFQELIQYVFFTNSNQIFFSVVPLFLQDQNWIPFVRICVCDAAAPIWPDLLDLAPFFQTWR